MGFFPLTSIYVNFAPLTTNHLFFRWRKTTVPCDARKFIIQLKALLRKKDILQRFAFSELIILLTRRDNCVIILGN